MKFTFKVIDKIKEAFIIFKEKFVSIISISAVFTIIMFLPTLFSQKYSNPAVSIPFYIIIAIVIMYVGFAWVRFFLNLIDKKESKLFSSKIFPSPRQLWNYISTSILVGIIFIIGFIALIVPGLYLFGRLFLAVYISIDENKNAIESIKKSWSMSENYGWTILGKNISLGLYLLLASIIFNIVLSILMIVVPQNIKTEISFVIIYLVQTIVFTPIGIIVILTLYREFVNMKSQIPAPTVEVPAEKVEEKIETKVEGTQQ